MRRLSGIQGSDSGCVEQSDLQDFIPANVQVDHNMHDRLMCSVIMMDDMDFHDMKMEGDGELDVRFFKNKVDAVLQELLADECFDS
jgi:hypothetical protein